MLRAVLISTLSIVTGSVASGNGSFNQTLPTQTSGQAKPTTTAPAPAPAAPLPFPADARAGYVNMQQVVAESKLGKCGQDKMKALLDQQAKEVQDLNKQVQTQQQKMQAQQGVVSDSVMQSMQRELDRLQREGQAKVQDNQARQQELNQDLLQNFEEKVLPVIEQVRIEKKLWFIFNAAQEGSNILAGDKSLDLSSEIIKALDMAQPDPCPKKGS